MDLLEATNYYLESDSQTIRVYHGTSVAFDKFDPSSDPVNDDGYMGMGSYFHEDKLVAQQYAYMALDKVGVKPLLYICDITPTKVYRGDTDTYGLSRQEIIELTKSLITQGYDCTTNNDGEWCVYDPSIIKVLKMVEIKDDLN